MTSRIAFKLSIFCGYLAAFGLCALCILMLYGAVRYQTGFFIHAVLILIFFLAAVLFYGRARHLRRLRRLDAGDEAWAAFCKWELAQQLLIAAICLLLLAMAAHRIFNEGYAVFG